MYHPQRLILALAVIATSVVMGGCFHHQKTYTAEVMPPPPVYHPPIK